MMGSIGVTFFILAVLSGVNSQDLSGGLGSFTFSNFHLSYFKYYKLKCLLREKFKAINILDCVHCVITYYAKF